VTHDAAAFALVAAASVGKLVLEGV
jgi:hypothetical protein